MNRQVLDKNNSCNNQEYTLNQAKSDLEFYDSIYSFIIENTTELNCLIKLDNCNNIDDVFAIYRETLKKAYHKETYEKEVRINQMLYNTLEEINSNYNIGPKENNEFTEKITKLKIKDNLKLESMIKTEDSKFPSDYNVKLNQPNQVDKPIKLNKKIKTNCLDKENIPVEINNCNKIIKPIGSERIKPIIWSIW